VKRYCVDSLATVLFFTVVATLAEVFVARMSLDQVLTSRSTAIPVMLLTGRPYGLWRDLWFRFGAAERRSGAARLALDVGAFLTFQVPVYAGILWISGASGAQMAAALGSATVMMALVGRPFGVFLEFCRGLARVAPRASRS